MALVLSPYIFRVGDDVLEGIIDTVVTSDGDTPRTVVLLSHICQRIRQLILARASFWTGLKIGDKTHPELIHLFLEHSHQLPLKIWVSNIQPGNTIGPDTRAATPDLLNALNCAMPRFAQSCSIYMSRVNSAALAGLQERLAFALGSDQPAVRTLDVREVPCVPLLGLCGPHLTHLHLFEVDGFSLQWLHSVLQLAPNLVVLELDSPEFHNAFDDEIPDLGSFNTSQSCQIRDLVVYMNMDGEGLSLVIDLIHRAYPSVFLTAQLVSLRTFDDGQSVEKLDLKRFTSADTLEICDNDYRVTYPPLVTTLPDPTSDVEHAPIRYQTSPRDGFTRVFTCWVEALDSDGPHLEAVRHIASSVRALHFHDLDSRLEFRDLDFLWSSAGKGHIFNLATISWPFVQHLSLSMQVYSGIPENAISQSYPQRRRVRLPRLSTLNLVLKLGSLQPKYSTLSPSWDPFPECFFAGRATILKFRIPASVHLSLTVDLGAYKPVPESLVQRLLDDLAKFIREI